MSIPHWSADGAPRWLCPQTESEGTCPLFRTTPPPPVSLFNTQRMPALPACRLMAQLFETPVSAVTLIDDGELQFVSQAGDWISCTGREGSFCDRILLPEVPTLLIVEDAMEDVRWAGWLGWLAGLAGWAGWLAGLAGC